MKLVSLKQKYSDMAKERPGDAESDEYYPCLYLDEKQMEALGIDAAPRVGTEMQMIATVRVSSVSDSKGGGRSISFEIAEAALAPKTKEPDAASVLFPNG
ncbi:capsid staple protein [Bradyrhizobium sp. HKCCYLS2038]|uniref:capsid staple protein n=1 Tax=Bradyrhizobium sp. HKCCYLS2038 TaxID=3420764 RepID=UPI003EBB9256